MVSNKKRERVRDRARAKERERSMERERERVDSIHGKLCDGGGWLAWFRLLAIFVHICLPVDKTKHDFYVGA